MSEEIVRLSAILPNYNHGAVIGEAIIALAAQVPVPDEIIVIDDGSRDDSLARLADLQSRLPRLRVVALERNIGAIGALNRGLLEARGKFVYFGAADDLALPGLFASLLPLLEANPSIAFASGECVLREADTGKESFRPPVRPAQVARVFTPAEIETLFRRCDNWILTGAALVRRDLACAFGGFDHDLGALADGYLLRRLAFAHGAAFTPHLGMVWRISASGMSVAQAASADRSLAVLKLALNRLSADPVFPPWYVDAFERRWRFSIGRLAVMAQPMNRDVLDRVVARGPLGRWLLRTAAAVGGPLGRLASLMWLTARERPMSLVGLVRTFLARSRSGAGVAQRPRA